VLGGELLRVQRKGELVAPRYLKAPQRRRLLPVAATLAGALLALRGARREDAEDALEAVEHGAADRLVVAGLRKLLFDRCDFACAEGADPAAVREVVFRAASQQRRALEPHQPFDREAALAAAAAELALGPNDLAGRLFADLRANERLVDYRALGPEALLDRYDLALAQGVLLRATRVEIALDGEPPGRVRQLFRAARFHGLLHRVRDAGDGRWHVELDGPFSLFQAVQRYGMSLALFLPAVLACERWRLRAEVLWGPQRARAFFELGPEQGLRARERPPTGVAPELDRFVDAFRALGSRWQVAVNDRIVALPGEVVCVPDLVFESLDTGEEVFLEAFGYWSRNAVWQRIESIGRGFPGRIILAVGKQLRVSEEALADDEAGELYVYKDAMRPRAVLERLER
jgi:uncharacterized protein